MVNITVRDQQMLSYIRTNSFQMSLLISPNLQADPSSDGKLKNDQLRPNEECSIN